MSFPVLTPSSRRFTPSRWPMTRHKFMTGQKQSVLFASSAYKAELRLVYTNRTPTEIALFMAHYDSQSGTHSSFSLPSDWAENVWDGWDKVKQDEKILAIDGRWRYAAPPRISQQKGKTATAEIVLVQVPGTKNVRIEGAAADACFGAGPPIDPGTEINPDPGAEEGPDGNGPGGFPGGGGGGGGGSGGGGPSGPTPTPSPGPGDPVAPIICPFGSELVDGVCVPLPLDRIPRIAPLRNRTQFLNNIYTKGSSCLAFPAPANTCEYRESGNYYWNDAETKMPEGVPPFRWEKQGEWNGNLEREPGNGGSRCLQWLSTNEEVIYPEWVLLDRFDKIIGSYGPTTSGCLNCCVLPEGGQQSLYLSPSWTIVGYHKLFDDEFGPKGNYYEPLLEHPPLGPNLYEGARNTSTANQRALSEPRATTTTTTSPGVFPRHTPSRRSMKYGEWNTKKFNGGKSGQAVTLPLPKKSIKSDVILELVYANRADGVARDFMNHYLASAGEWDDFKLPNEELKKGPMAGWSVNNGDRYLSKGRWAYNRPPIVTSVHPGTSTVTVQLISLESKAFAGPGVEITPLDPCECPPAYSPGEPSPDGGGPDGPTPSPSPGPGKPSPEPPATVPPNWPSDFDPAIWPPGVPISAPVPSSKNPITEPDDDWQEANNPEKEVYYIRFKWKSFGYREGTEVCRKPGFGPCADGTPQGERYAVGPAHSKIAEGNWDTWINLPGIQYGAAWTLYPWDDDANFGYWYKPPGSGFDNSSITQRGVCFAPDDYTTDKYTCDEVDPNYLSRRGIIRLMSSQTMTSGATTELSSLWGSNNPNLSDDEGLWTHATVITQVQLRPASSSEWIPYVDNSTAWSGLSATRSASGPTQQ